MPESDPYAAPQTADAPDPAALLATLVGFDTVSDRSNLPLIDWVEATCLRHGAAVERVPDETGRKAALLVSVGPYETRPGYVLSGHSDVVPVEGQPWSSDPFTLREEGGRLYGRGTSDMKGFLAVCLALLPEMAAADLAIPLHLAISYDEEVGCLGVRPLIARMLERVPRPLGCFVGEPTGMEVVAGHKGKSAARLTFRGRASHSALAPQGVNAVEYAARFIEHVRLSAEALARDGARDALYDVPHTTGLSSVVQGGAALNIVPDTCSVSFEYRATGASGSVSRPG
jgi:acetylornithine deacetylase